jgi:hypothetical protein
MNKIRGGLVIGALIAAGLLGGYHGALERKDRETPKTLLCMWEGGSMKFEGHVELLPDRKYKVTKEDGSDYTIVIPPVNAPCVISKTVNATETTTSTKPPDINT